MKLKVFQGFYLFMFVTIKPCCKEMCVTWVLSTVWEQAQCFWCSLIGCGGSAGYSFMSRKCGFVVLGFFFPAKWSSALSFAVSCILGCSSCWKVSALLSCWNGTTALCMWGMAALCSTILCKDSTEHCCYRPAAATCIELSRFMWGERSEKEVFKENVALW